MWKILILACDIYVWKYMIITACFSVVLGFRCPWTFLRLVRALTGTGHFTHGATFETFLPIPYSLLQWWFCLTFTFSAHLCPQSSLILFSYPGSIGFSGSIFLLDHSNPVSPVLYSLIPVSLNSFFSLFAWTLHSLCT